MRKRDLAILMLSGFAIFFTLQVIDLPTNRLLILSSTIPYPSRALNRSVTRASFEFSCICRIRLPIRSTNGGMLARLYKNFRWNLLISYVFKSMLTL